jgi:Fibronectin type III domain
MLSVLGFLSSSAHMYSFIAIFSVVQYSMNSVLVAGKAKSEPSASATDEMEPPPQPQVSRLSDSSVQLHWIRLPSNNSLPVVLYKIQYQEVSSTGGKISNWVTVESEIPPTQQQFDVINLKPGLLSC